MVNFLLLFSLLSFLPSAPFVRGAVNSFTFFFIFIFCVYLWKSLSSALSSPGSGEILPFYSWFFVYFVVKFLQKDSISFQKKVLQSRVIWLGKENWIWRGVPITIYFLQYHSSLLCRLSQAIQQRLQRRRYQKSKSSTDTNVLSVTHCRTLMNVVIPINSG